jgi:pimeloyl-ACP methyl ester carboxylesterase
MSGRMREAIERREGIALVQFEPAWLGERLAQPVLVVHDRNDRAAPLAAAQALVDALPAAQLHITEGLSHRRVLTDPAVLARVIDHLGRPNTAAL